MSSRTEAAPELALFGGHRWVFWLLAFLPAVALLASNTCTENGGWPARVLLTVMLMACLWEAHAQALRMGLAGKGMLWQVCKRALKTLLSVIFAGLLPLVLIGISLPGYTCNAPDRAKVYEAIQVNTSELRREIERRASINKTLKGAGLGLTLPPRQDAALTARSNGLVLEDGIIVLVIEEPPTTVRFTPKLVNANSGAIEWSCRGYPAKSVPYKCREPQ